MGHSYWTFEGANLKQTVRVEEHAGLSSVVYFEQFSMVIPSEDKRGVINLALMSMAGFWLVFRCKNG